MTHRFAAALALVLATAPAAALAASAEPSAMPAGHYAIDHQHAFLVGKVNHMGMSTYVFRFDRFDAGYDYDPTKPTAAKINVSVDLNSLNTGWDKADKQFAPEFMGAAKTPTATFVSTAITHQGNKGQVTGDLTLNGVTKPVTLDVTFVGYEPNGFEAHKAGFAATGVIKRSEFGLTKYLPMVGNEVTLEINAEFKKQ